MNRELRWPLSELLDEEGQTQYERMAEMFAPFDPQFSGWLARSPSQVLGPLGEMEARKDAIETISGFGRSKWAVAAAALRELSAFEGVKPGFLLSWLRHARAIADVDQDAALKYCEASRPVYDILGADLFDTWASLGRELTQKSWKAAKEYFNAGPEVVGKIEPCDLEEWVRIGLEVIEKSPRVRVSYDAHSLLAAGASAGKSKSLDLGVQYFRSAPQVLGRIGIEDLKQWAKKGLEDLAGQKAFFSLDTAKSRQAIEGLVKGLELKDVRAVLGSYAEALSGRWVPLKSSSVFYRNLPGLSRFFSVTDGTRIFLPPRVAQFEDRELNFKTYKMILAHEMAHLMFGTYELRAADLRNALSSCRDDALAFKVFEFLEDERVDFLMACEYPGLEKDRRALRKKHLQTVGQDLHSAFGVFVPGDSRDDEADGRNGDRLKSLLRTSAERAKAPGTTARDVLGIALDVYSEVEAVEGAAACEGLKAHDRVFYRGPIDFEMVEEARSGMERLVVSVLDRMKQKKKEPARDDVEEALRRVEDSEGLEPEALPWQVTAGEKLDELLELTEAALEEIEAERQIRRTAYYDEWDRNLEDYRKEWCRVREMDMPATNAAFYSRTVSENYGLVSQLRKHFSMLKPDRVQRFFREERGDDIDYDALLESVVERRAGLTPSDRVYIRREKNLRDVSVAFLVDMSYSTGEELPSGKTIIDVEKTGLILMAEALESIGDQWAVYGFSSNAREKVDFYVVHDFDRPFSDESRMRYENIRPMAQTRLGAAIRHANGILRRRPSKIRLLILLSDGRPYDVDYGDALYAIEDTRQALWEGRRDGINSFCITVDKKSREYLPYMYGEANFTLIEDIEALPAMLPLIYKRLTT
ncbi:MAG: VWA domain-containing protein [Nitrospirota bacterium]